MLAKPHKGGKYIWLGSVLEFITGLLAGGLLPGVQHVSGRVMSEGERKIQCIPVIFSPLVRLQLLHKHRIFVTC